MKIKDVNEAKKAVGYYHGSNIFPKDIEQTILEVLNEKLETMERDENTRLDSLYNNDIKYATLEAIFEGEFSDEATHKLIKIIDKNAKELSEYIFNKIGV